MNSIAHVAREAKGLRETDQAAVGRLEKELSAARHETQTALAERDEALERSEHEKELLLKGLTYLEVAMQATPLMVAMQATPLMVAMQATPLMNHIFIHTGAPGTGTGGPRCCDATCCWGEKRNHSAGGACRGMLACMPAR